MRYSHIGIECHEGEKQKINKNKMSLPTGTTPFRILCTADPRRDVKSVINRKTLY